MTRNRVNEIDLLRFLAALAVVFFHYAFRGYAADGLTILPYLSLSSVAKYGYLGVQLFFMISGFVILMTAANGSLQDFVVSRIVRLYPAFWICCTVTFLFIVLLGEPIYSASLGEYLVNLTMLSGIVGVESIDDAYWSLFIELNFYGLVTVVLFFKKIHSAERFIAAWLLMSIALKGVDRIYPSTILSSIFIIEYSEYFVAGATFYFIWSKGLSPVRGVIILLTWGLALFKTLRALPKFEAHYSVVMDYYVVVAVVSAFFVVMFFVSMRYTGRLGKIDWRFLGVLTYPLYLIHQKVGFIIFNNLYLKVNVDIIFWGTFALVLLFAYIIHRVFEIRLAALMRISLSKIFVKPVLV